MLEGDTPGVLYGCEYKGFAGIGICKVMKIKGDKNRAVGGSWGGGMVAAEVRGGQWASIVASVGIKDSRRVRGDNWSEGRLRCSWPRFSTVVSYDCVGGEMGSPHAFCLRGVQQDRNITHDIRRRSGPLIEPIRAVVLGFKQINQGLPQVPWFDIAASAEERQDSLVSRSPRRAPLTAKPV